MSKHTPGPWSEKLLGHHCIQAREGTRENVTLAEVFSMMEPGEREANAALIAAAPDLLALAHQYADECAECNGTGTRWTQPQDPQDSTEYPCPKCADIRAVIDKAEGRT